MEINNKSTKDYLKNANLNKGLAEKLKARIEFASKRNSNANLPPKTAKERSYEYLTPEKILKELNKEGSFGKYDVIDISNRVVVIPAGYALSEETVELLKQLVRTAPYMLYIRQADPIVKDKLEFDTPLPTLSGVN